jgi:hypothetical protein
LSLRSQAATAQSEVGVGVKSQVIRIDQFEAKWSDGLLDYRSRFGGAPVT